MIAVSDFIEHWLLTNSRNSSVSCSGGTLIRFPEEPSFDKLMSESYLDGKIPKAKVLPNVSKHFMRGSHTRQHRSLTNPSRI